MKNFVYRFLSTGIVPTDLDMLRKLMMANAFLLISSITFLIFTALNFTLFHSPMLGIFDGLAFLASVFALIDLHRNHTLERAIIIGSVSFFFFFLIFAYTNQNTDFGLIWTIFFPIFVITLMGHQKGLRLTALFYFLLFSLAYHGIGIWNGGEWNFRSFLRFSIASAVLTYVVYVYEAALYRSNIELFAIREKEAKYLQELQRLSVTDPLTGLYNRRRMDEVTQEQVEYVKRYRVPFSIIMFDIDDFKLINDRFGHIIGDQVLVTIAEITKKSLRKTDYIGRWGGEEFLILLPKTPSQEAAIIAEKLRQELEDANYSHHAKVTCSFGIAQCDGALTIENIIDQADQALYRAKESGKNCVCINTNASEASFELPYKDLEEKNSAEGSLQKQ
ncbi:GGDEF domain-containing protein [Sulfuricurvum sp.]|uniref:GGDEF domain-containing protein n=1 Tax=Sulfuricurvum sp. TaxID=2025608 RepID=UPI003BB0E789